MAYLGELQLRPGSDSGRQMMDYLRQLEEQVRYALQNLDGDNIQEGAIGEAQLSQGVQGRLQSVETAVRQVREAQTQEKAMTRKLLAGKAQKAEGTLPFQLYVGTERPQGGGILWFLPGDEQNGRRVCAVYYIGEE